MRLLPRLLEDDRCDWIAHQLDFPKCGDSSKSFPHSAVTVKRPETEELNKQIYMHIETETVILTKGNEKRPCTGTKIYICSIIVSDQVQWNSVAAWHDVCLQASAKSRSISYRLSAPARSQGRKGSSSGHRSHTGVASASVPTQTPEVHERCFRRTRWSDDCTTCISSGHACWHSRWGQWRTCSHTGTLPHAPPHPAPPHPCLHAHNGTHRDESTYLASSHERYHMPHPTPPHPPQCARKRTAR